jgi:NAD(P)-dependent dehydrogenase (short-subunit alcohol dehydrogenase family)
MDKIRAHPQLSQQNKMGRLGEVEEMAKLMAFLVSDDNSYMTGSNIISDGGVA